MLDNTNLKKGISFISLSCCHCQDSYQLHILLQNQATPLEVWLLLQLFGSRQFMVCIDCCIALGSLSSLAWLMLVVPDFHLCLESPAEHPLGCLNGPTLNAVEVQ
jgi:hypothetical protein